MKLMKGEKRYIVDVPKFKFRGEWRYKGDLINMNVEERIFFLVYVKPYKPNVVTTKDLGGLIEGSKPGLIKGGKQ